MKIKHHTMTAYGEWSYSSTSLGQISTLDGGVWRGMAKWTHLRSYTRGMAPGTYCIDGCVGSRTDLEFAGVENPLGLTENKTPNPRSYSM
jgi:hypothetical protein